MDSDDSPAGDAYPDGPGSEGPGSDVLGPDGVGGGRPARAGYRRSAGSPRGEARRRELLGRVTADLAANGLVGFSLRRAARAAGTTHKVLLYHFDGPDDLLRQAILELRRRRVDNALGAADRLPDGGTLAERVRVVWQVILDEESRVLDQAVALTMYDGDRYAELGRGASELYLPALLSLCPDGWPDRRRREVAEMVLAVLRGFLVRRAVGGTDAEVDAGFAALLRALDREEAAGG